jgi:epoxyqueuosine reductase
MEVMRDVDRSGLEVGDLTENLRELALAKGAALVGFAPVERFETLPLECGPKPQEVYPGARSVIAFAVQMPDACMERAAHHEYNDPEGGVINHAVSERINIICYQLSRRLEAAGFAAFPVSATTAWRYRPYKQYPTPFLADISHRHTAAAAGLGEFGWNGLLMTPQYGPRVRLGTVITSADLSPTPLYDGPALCDRCMRCVRECGKNIQGLTKEVRGTVRFTLGGKKFEYANKNLWRCAWTENFAIWYAAPKPEICNEETMKKVFLDINEKHPEWCKCWTVEPCWGQCLPPDIRYDDPAYAKVPRRRKQNLLADKTQSQVQKLVQDRTAALVNAKWRHAVARIVDMRTRFQLRQRLAWYMPDAASAIVVRVDMHPGVMPVEASVWGRMRQLELDLITFADAQGLSAIQLSFLRESKEGRDVFKSLLLASELHSGDFHDEFFCEGPDHRYAAVLLSAELSDELLNLHAPEVKLSGNLSVQIKELIKELGADLVGIASAGRMNGISDQLSLIYKGQERLVAVNLKQFSPPVPYLPKVDQVPLKAYRPEDHLPGAKSVIVVGIRFSDAIVDNSTTAPAEAIGPYGIMRTGISYALYDIGITVVELLKDWGYNAAVAPDLCGLGSLFPFPIRRFLHDSYCSRFAAVGAGLGELGRHGMVLTPQYGARQAFFSIVTDAPLSEDPVYSGPALCNDCGKCAASCPVKAIAASDVVEMNVDGKRFAWGRFSHMHCDWAKRYGLVAAEGPQFVGSETNILPPATITKQDLTRALENIDMVQKDYFEIMEPCLLACQAHSPASER